MFLMIAMLLLGYTPAHAEAPEYQVKAAILANFALFVEWPGAAFPSAGSAFVACVVGNDPFGSYLNKEMGERVGGHPVEIRHLNRTDSARECHLVFISRSEQPRLKQVLAQLQNTSALTVSDASDIGEFCRQGGMIGLVMEGRKVRFQLNANAASKAGLKVDSKLTRVSSSSECGGGR